LPDGKVAKDLKNKQASEETIAKLLKTQRETFEKCEKQSIQNVEDLEKANRKLIEGNVCQFST
jgi:hypothetical protein